MVEKHPRHAEFRSQMRRQRFHAEGLRRVMAAVKHVNAQFLGQRIIPVRAFAGDERVHAFVAASFKPSPAPPVTTPMRRKFPRRRE